MNVNVPELLPACPTSHSNLNDDLSRFGTLASRVVLRPRPGVRPVCALAHLAIVWRVS